MAKTKKQKFEVDDYGFSSDLDIPDFDFKPEPVKDDRTPVTKAAKAFGKGALDQAKSPTFIKNLVKKSMPKGYGEAADLTGEATGALKDLYDTAAKELKPAINDAKKVTRRMLPSIEASLPKSVADKLKNWAKDEALAAQQAKDDARESSISMTLGSIFQMQTEIGQQQQAEQKLQNQMSESFAQKRHLDQMGQLDAMRVSLQQLANYQNRIEANYQKKSLELQFRHYFVAVDALEEQKRMNAIAQAELAGIKKNTGLPEFAKLKASERFWEITRNKFAQNLEDKLLSKPRAFIQNLGTKLAGRVKDSMSGFAQNVQMGLSGADMAMDMHEMDQQMAEMMGEAPKSWKERFAGMAGGMATDAVGTRVGKWLRKRTEKNAKLVKGSNQLLYGMQNLPGAAGNFARGSFLDGVPGIQAVKDTILDLISPDNRVQSDQAGSLQDPDVFSRQTNKSVTEVIPGFLARIYRELKIIRTGDESQKLVHYDYTNNSFSDSDSITKNIYKSIVRDSDRSNVKYEMDQLLKQIDPDGTKLTPEQRKALTVQLLRDNVNNEMPSPERLSNLSSYYQGDAARHATTFAQLFSEHFADDPRAEKKLAFSTAYNNLGSGVALSRKTIQDFVNTGNRDELERAGILKKGSNAIDIEQLLNYYAGDDMQLPDESPAQASSRRMRRAMRPRGPGNRQAGNILFGSSPEPVATPAPVEQPSPLRDKVSSTEEIVKALQETNEPIKGGLDQINATLIRIEERLANGIVAFKGEEIAAAMGNRARNFAARGKDALRKGKHWWDRTLGQTAGGLLGLARKGIGYGLTTMKNAGDRLFKLGKGAANFGLGVLGDIKDIAFGQAGSVFDRLRQIKDIYVPGDAKARMKAWAIKAGEYKDAATGKVIKSYKDIKGAVVDKYGNEILSAEEALKAFIKDGWKMRTLKAMGAVVGKIKDAAGSILGMVPPSVRFALRTAKNLTMKGVNALFDAPKDVYVQGKKDPVLLARVMKEGGYFRADGSAVIRRPGQINGAVKDAQGNLVLTQEEFEKGLFDWQGKPIRSRLGNALNLGSRLLDKARGLATSAWRLGSKVAGFAWDKTKAMAGTMWDATKRALNLDKAGKKISQKFDPLDPQRIMIKRLTEIRNILNERLEKKTKLLGDSDGDGIRDGSYKDLLKKQKDRLLGLKDKAVGKGKGGLAALAGLLGNKGAGAGAAAAAEGGGGWLNTIANLLQIGTLLGGAKAMGGKALAGAGRLLGGAGRMVGGLSTTGLLAKLAMPAAAGTAAWSGIQSEASGKRVEGLTDVVPEGFWGKLNPFAYAMNMGRLVGNKQNEKYGWWSKLLGGSGSFGSDLYGAFHKDPMKQMEEEEKKRLAERKANPQAATPKPEEKKPASQIPLAPTITPTGLPAATKADTPRITIQGAPLVTALPQMSQKPVDALSALRYKAYGLKELDADKVAALQALEREVVPGLEFDKNAAKWTGKPMELLDGVGQRFGTKVGGPEFLNWLQGRFMPVFLSFAGTTMAMTGSKDPLTASLTPEQSLEVGRAIMSSKGQWGGPIWDTAISPWDGYELSKNPEGAQANLTALLNEAKQKGNVLKDPTAKAADKSENKPKTNSLGDGNSDATKQALGQKPEDKPSFMGALKDRLKDIWEGAKTLAKDTASGAQQAATSAYQGAKNAVTSVFGGGQEVTHPGAGTGGDINSLPIPKGEGKYEHFRELFEKVGQMVGVDPKLMAAMAAVESGFNSKIRAASSSATGLFQFVSDTWKTMLKKYGPQYGIAPNTPPTDARANALLGALYIKENIEGLKGVVNRPLTATDAYMAHFLGLGGARQFLRANPNASGPETMPKAAASNRSIFWNQDGSPRTLGEIYGEMRRRMESRAKSLGLNLGGPADEAAPQAPTDAAATSADPAQQAGAKGGGYGGSIQKTEPMIPVADQQPGVPASGTIPVPAPTRADSRPAPRLDPAVAAAGAGFQPSGPKSLQETQKFQREISSEAFAPLTNIAKEHLGVSQTQLEVLTAIRDILKNQKSEGSAKTPPSDTDAASSAPSIRPRGPARPATNSPVSMAKSTFT